jgi:hypothetical protein
MSVRAPQYGRRGPNPAALKGPRVEPFGTGFALVEGLGVISLHRGETEAKTALEAYLERRERLNVVLNNNAVQAPKGDARAGSEQHDPSQPITRQPPNGERQADADNAVEESADALRHGSDE